MSAQPIGGRLAWTTSLLVMLTKRPYHSLSTRPMEKQIYQKIEVFQYRHELVVQTEAQIFSVCPRFLDIKGLVNQDFLLIFDDETSSKRLEKLDTVLKPKVKLAKSLTTTTDLRHLLK